MKRLSRRRRSTSRRIALAALAVDASATYIVLYFCYLSILRDFTGTLPYLTTLIGALQAATAVVLTAYFGKSKAENIRGGITYDTAVNSQSDCE